MAPIPQLRLPFTGDYPITFRFGEVPTDPQLQQLYSTWKIKGHTGVDFAVPLGVEVLAVDRGMVTQAGDRPGFGLSITIEHSWGVSIVGHLSALWIEVGDGVVGGQVIGISGASGEVSGPHVHFGIKPYPAKRDNGYQGYIDPWPYLDRAPVIEAVPKIESVPAPTRVKPVKASKPKEKEVPSTARKAKGASPRDPLAAHRYKGVQKRQDKQSKNFAAVMKLAAQGKPITNAHVQKLLGLSQSAATLYLRELVAKKKLQRIGTRKKTIYIL